MSLRVYENEAAFQATQADKSVKFTPRSFLASGLFVGGGSGDIVFLDPEAEDFRAPARAFLTGEVQKTERRQNPETGQEFTWALIGTAGGTFDLVADDTVLPRSLGPRHDRRGRVLAMRPAHGNLRRRLIARKHFLCASSMCIMHRAMMYVSGNANQYRY